MNQHARRILHELLSLPTAPFAEHYVLAHIQAFIAARKHISAVPDAAGNLLCHLKIGRRSNPHPICLTAHTDHPGFVAERMVSPTRLRAHWRGGVLREYFEGSRVRFYLAGRWVRGTIVATTTMLNDGREHVCSVEVEVPREIPPYTIGMWDFPDPRIRGNRIYARGCDDLAGVAALLATVDELCRSAKPCEAFFLFTRAEEVGFVGAIHAARTKTVPHRCLVVTMETSSQRVNARMGDGPILRVGDKATAFSPTATAHCQRVADRLVREGERSSGRRPGAGPRSARPKGGAAFAYQRKLMDGGTCESSVFANCGYDATGICIALGNYHNMNQRTKRIGPEYVDLHDYDSVVRWFVELARGTEPYRGKDEAFLTRMRKLEKTYAALLKQSRNAPR